MADPMGALDPASDAAIMLRVAGGRRIGFQLSGWEVPPGHDSFPVPDGPRNQAVAEELAQEVFCASIAPERATGPEAKFTTWLYRIATNLAVNHARDTRHERAAQTPLSGCAG